MIILPFDLLEHIINIRINNIENEINNLNYKINKIKKILKPLKIYKKSNNSYEIKYDYINYCLKSYLFDIAIKGKVFIIYPGYIYEHNTEYISSMLINPTYFTLLFEANKTYYKFKEYYNNKIINFKSIYNFDEYKCKIYRIILNNDISYIELILN